MHIRSFANEIIDIGNLDLEIRVERTNRKLAGIKNVAKTGTVSSEYLCRKLNEHLARQLKKKKKR